MGKAKAPFDIVRWARAPVDGPDTIDDFIEPPDGVSLTDMPGILVNPNGYSTRGLRPSGKSKRMREFRDD
jgi:hypothetical protein